jgi:hypothetical protein
MLGFDLGIALLRGEPTRERLPVVVIDDTAQSLDRTLYRYTVAMTIIGVACAANAVKHGAWRVQRSPQRSTMNAIDEGCAEAGSILRPFKC